MENTPAAAPHSSKTSPRDFFLWAGVVIALLGSVISLTTLLFSYINFAYPDVLSYDGDPFGESVRVAMACVLVFMPTVLVLMHIIRASILKEAGKASIWVRRWALGLIIFLATITMLIDLITLLTTFLGGELTMRFVLKVAVVLLVAGFVFMHFLADLKGYWFENAKKAGLISSAVLAMTLVTVGAGFIIIGTPSQMREYRYDEQKVSDLESIQYQVVSYYQQKQALPESLAALNDPLSSFMVPVDAQEGNAYTYAVTGPLSFELCATFNAPTRATSGTRPSMSENDNWMHEAGQTCFMRTIDPELYPPFDKAI